MIIASVLTNPWFIGIGAGIVSGLIVFVITRIIFGRRENREYHQKVLAANRELLHGIRPTVAESQIPERDVINAMHASIARRFVVDPKDMSSTDEVVEDLTMEVMESSFISSQIKAEFCQKLASLIAKPGDSGISITPHFLQSTSELISSQRSQLVTMMSVMMGLMAGLMTAMLPVLADLGDGSFLDNLVGSPRRLTILMVPAAAMVLTAYTAVFMRRIALRKHSSNQIEVKGGEKKMNRRREWGYSAFPTSCRWMTVLG